MNQCIRLISCSILVLTLTADRSQAQSNVTIQVKNGSLQVTGQNNSTQCLLVTPTGVPGQYEFSMPPLDNGAATLFNGETSLIVSGVTGDMRFDLKSGNKMLILSNSELGGAFVTPVFVVPRNLKISSSGSSPVTVILNKVYTTNANTEITTKNGNDAILLMDCNLTGNVKINSGGGNDVLLVSGYATSFAYMQQCDINMGSGNDHLLMEDVFVPFQAKFNLGSGNDKVAFLRGEFGTTAINGGGGFDELAVSNSNFATLSVRSLEDQTSNNFVDIYINAFYTNATFAAAYYIWIFIVFS